MSALHTLLMLGGSDFDSLGRSEARVIRRVGGGRQEIWRDGRWHPYAPPPRSGPVVATTTEDGGPERLPDLCAKGHKADWYINPNSGWRNCRECRRRYHHSRTSEGRAREAAQKRARRASRGVAALQPSHQT